MKNKKLNKKIGYMVVVLFIFCICHLAAEPCGDVNSDGSIDIVDALLVAQYYVGLNPGNFDTVAADVNGDGSIDIVDALLIARYYVELISGLPGCSETPTPTSSATSTEIPTPDPNQTPGPTTPPLYDNAWIPDLGDGTYKNPVIYADYSDPDIIKVGSDFYMTASSFNCVPGLPVLHSKDLVNWTLIGHAIQKQVPEAVFDKPQHGKGVWAPSIRYHDNHYWIFWGDPDYGIYMVKSDNPAGPWEPQVLVLSGKGMIDTCPIWDDDGNAYLVHAWAKSRVGYNSILTLRRMRPDGTGFLDNGTKIFDGNNGVATTIEGPKFYKRNGYYYIFAPAGGVANGWQVVLRSSDIYGPYEIRTVMEKGNTTINGPHQGGYVELESGESWFMHFQQVGSYGRLVHLNPLVWRSDNWPIIGNDPDGDGTGNPVSSHGKPDVGGTYPVQIPQTSDDFTSEALGFQWQWQANPKPGWLSLTDRSGYLRLYSQAQAGSNLSETPNLLLQKLSSESFTVTTHVMLNANPDGEKAGLIVISNYAYIAVQRESGSQYRITGNSGNASLQGNSAYLRVTVSAGPRCQFSYSTDGQNFRNLGSSFTADATGWIGSKVGLFSLTPQNKTDGGYADFDFFRFE